MLTLITGGARSGKTRFALSLGANMRPCTYVATAELLDEEMRERARRHREERGSRWETLEEPCQVAEILGTLTGVVVIDCLTILLSNWMLRGVETPPNLGGVPGRREGGVVPPVSGGNHPVCADKEQMHLLDGAATPPNLGGEWWLLKNINRLCSAFSEANSHVIAITNEVGSSIVPDNPLARQFRDWSGLLNQRAAACATDVYMMVCGLPLRVK